MEMLYLAVPYTGMEEKSFKAVNLLAGELMQAGFAVFSPISTGHPIAQVCKMPTEWGFWLKMDREFLKRYDTLAVLTLPGWEESTGVQAEIELAIEFEKPVVFLGAHRAPYTKAGIGELKKIWEHCLA